MHPHRLIRRQDDGSLRRIQGRRRPHVEALEVRQLLSTFPVTNTNDSGANSLRQAIISSNAATSSTPNTISFNIGSGGVQTISVLSALPKITQPVIIDGTTQPDTPTSPEIVLDGTHAGAKAIGLDLQASNSVVKGLAIDDFAGGGVRLTGVSNDSITTDYIGVTTAGNVAAGDGKFGLELTGVASDNAVTNDVISASGGTGVILTGGSNGNVVAGDLIGTYASGTHALGNAGNGVMIEDQAIDNTIGGTTAAARDIISGNKNDGVLITGADGNTVEGDFIGTDSTGINPLGNATRGVAIKNASNDNIIGGTTTSARDIISANLFQGVYISGSTGNAVEGDFIGTDVSGSERLGNGAGPHGVDRSGVRIDSGSSGNIIGGTTADEADVISGNLYDGVHIVPGADNNVVEGDFIGTDLTGTEPLGNGRCGVEINKSSNGNTIGGTTSAARNIISANKLDGVLIGGSKNNLIEGDYIGTDVTGTKPLANGLSGVIVQAGARGNIIGGTGQAADVISFNTRNGVSLDGAGKGNHVEGDTIDGNGTNGVYIRKAPGNSVTGSTIENNQGWGILFIGNSAQHTTRKNNTVEDNTKGNVS